MEPLARCPACRARLADAPVCPRCGTDFSMTRRAERQAKALAHIAVRELLLGRTGQAAAAAEAALGLASPPLAVAVFRLIQRRESVQGDVFAHVPIDNEFLANARLGL